MNGNHEFIQIPPLDGQEYTLGFYLWSLDPRLMLADSSDICAILLHQPDNMKRLRCLMADMGQMRVFPAIVK